jgi:hypothetical protein
MKIKILYTLDLLHYVGVGLLVELYVLLNESFSNFTLGYSCTNFHTFNYMQYFLSLDKKNVLNSRILFLIASPPPFSYFLVNCFIFNLTITT